MVPSEVRRLCLQPNADRAHTELRRCAIDAAGLRRLLVHTDSHQWRAWSDTVELRDELGRRTEMAVHVPPYRPGRQLGVLIVLHGAGGSGQQILPHFTALGDQLSLAVLAPTAQLPARPSANLDLAGLFGSRFRMPRWDLAGNDFPLAALRWARTELGAAPDRCILTGISMGGLATWNLSMRFWHSFAAAVPLNGALSVWESFGTDIRTRALLSNTLPLTLFVVHGAKDKRISAEFDRASVATLRKLGHRQLDYVEVPEGEHGVHTLGLEEDSPLFRRLVHRLSKVTRRHNPLEIYHRTEEGTHARAHWVTLEGLMPGQFAHVHARRLAPDRIAIKADGARRVAVHLVSDGLMPGDTLTVTVNGSTFGVPFAPDLATVLDTYRESADPGLVAEQVVRFDVPELPDAEPEQSINRTGCRDADSI